MSNCFHCGEPLRGSTLIARIEQRDEPVCCSGCQAVAELIAGTGLGDFYRYRDGNSVRPRAVEQGDKWRVYADPQFASQFTRTARGQTSVTLLIEGLRCSACSWLIDQVLRRHPGVVDASVNAATGRASVTWDSSQLDLAEIMRTIARLGYVPHPLTDETVASALRQERRDSLKRLAVAGFGMMQVMMFAVAVYSAQIANEIMEPAMLNYFRIVSLLVATPVMFYAGAPILLSAWNSLRSRSVGMDVPVSIALVLAYAASVWNTFHGSGGEVYFDSVTMFIFFLTLGRFVQMSVRQHTAGVTDALARQLPSIAHRIGADGVEDVPVTSLRVGDVIQVRRGEVLPADGELIDPEAQLDEAMLTGESLPVRRMRGERLVAGTLNVEGPVRLSVTALGADTAMAHIVSLMQRAQTYKPALARNADAAAARFLQYVLLGAGLTCAVWLAIDPSRAFAATLAVLVVACPCAFAIAMPAALAAATASLGRLGILLTDSDALESLAKVDHIIFDKTGTLTRGELRVSKCVPLANISDTQCLKTAALLEQASEHPLARAFVPYHDGGAVEDIETVAGRGVQGRVDGRLYRIGSPEFVSELRRSQAPSNTPPNSAEAPLQHLPAAAGAMADARFPTTAAGEPASAQFPAAAAGEIAGAQFPATAARETAIARFLAAAAGEMTGAQFPAAAAGEMAAARFPTTAAGEPASAQLLAAAAAELAGARSLPPPPEAAGSVILLGDEHRTLASFELTDSLRPAAERAVNQLRALNIEPQILSGDGHAAVTAVASQCGIDKYFARHSAQEKLVHVLSLQKAGKRVAVIGDGVNDAPVLNAADVSIAMGRGAALAHASAGLILVSDNLAALPEAVLLARRTLRIARQNLLWAAIYNLGSIPLAALGFIPPWLAALGMSLSSVAVVLNSTRLMPSTPRRPNAAPAMAPTHLREKAA